MRALPLLPLLLLCSAPALAQPMPLTGEILISVSDATSRLRPGVAADRGGRFVVVWREIGGQDGGIAARRVSAAGVPLGTGFVVEPPEEGRHTTDPQVVCRAGGILAAWGEASFLRPGCAKAWALGPGDEEGVTFDLGACSAATSENGRAPKVALAGLRDGRFTAAWEEGPAMSTAGTDVVVRAFGAAGGPLSAALRVDSEGTGEDGFQTAPAVAQDAAGRSVVLWLDERTASLFGRRFDAAGRPLGARFLVSGGSPVESAVAAAPGGRFVAVWSAFDSLTGTRIFAQLFDAAGRKRGAPIPVSPADSPSRRHRAPDVAMDENGSFAVVWDADRIDSAGTGVLGRLYDRDGVPRSPAFRVNITGRGSQGHPAVAFAAGSRTFLVVWDSQRDAAARGSIVGRLYSTAQPVVP